jgi:hypothetical protein
MLIDSVTMDKLFCEIEKDLQNLEAATTASLLQLDADAGAALTRWLDNWTVLDEFA